ncbi:MAG: hypothetical protein KF699_07895 [Phycisphaeraceae bacterium]|nr:hypothetical protein [Phycisphaeraceae bacterium]MBX3408189.1 hypothetical protein [Phycisphaeraceae bacterium]
MSAAARWNSREFFKTVALTTLMAALIWVWAEGESVSRVSIACRVELQADPFGDLVYRSDDPEWRGNITFQVEGSAAGIAAARELRGQTLRLTAGLAGMPVEPGPNRVARLREAIAAIPELSRLGVVVVSCEPSEVPVRVMRMITRDLPVRVELGRTLLLDGEPAASPATIVVRMPDSVLVPEGAQAVAFVSPEELDRVRGDGAAAAGARAAVASIRMPPWLAGIEPVQIAPESVVVSFRVRKETDTFRIAAVPVWFGLPPTEDVAQWTVEVLDKFVNDVTLTGPADQVGRVRSGEITLKALVELASDDLQRAVRSDRAAVDQPGPGADPAASGVISRPVTFLGLPPGVTAAAANPVVRVRVTRAGRASAEGLERPASGL